MLLSSCGGGSGGGGQNGADFNLTVTPSQLSLNQGANSAPVSISVTGKNGFFGMVSISIQGLPAGVMSTPTFPVSISTGNAQQFTLSAMESAAVGSTNIQFTGSSSGSTSTASLTLQIAQFTVSGTPSLKTTFANLDASPLTLGNGTSVEKLTVLDATRQQVFVSNTLLNEVDVFSTVTRQRLATIPVPDPYGIDITADGSTVYVGTFTDFLYVIDPQSLAVVRRISFAIPPNPGGGSAANSPQAVATLSNGKLLLLMDFGDQFGLANGTSLIVWDPADNTTVTLVGNTQDIGPIARSGDHTKAAFTFQEEGGGGTTVTIYDVASGQISTGTYSVGFIPYALAFNEDGSKIAVSGGVTLQTYDSGMNSLQSVNISTATEGLLFSTDGAKIYHFVFGGIVEVFDSTTLQQLGVASDIGLNGSGGTIPGDIDATGTVYGLSDHGLSFLDVSQPTTTDKSLSVGFAVPQAGPIGSATPTTSGAGGIALTPEVLFGSSPALDVSSSPFQQGEMISSTAPVSSTPGPVNVFLQWPDGLAWLEAEDFSYGPWSRYVFETGGPPQGGAPGILAGYGFGWNLGSPQISFGSRVATLNSLDGIGVFIEPYPYQQLQLAQMTLPSGPPGRAAVKIDSPLGTVTVPNAFHFMNQATQVPLSPNNLMGGVWDESRSVVYFSAGNQIQVFSTTSQQFLAPITIPNSTSATLLAGLAITPDDTKLVVADFGDSSVLIIDLNNPAAVTSVNLLLPAEQKSGTQANPISVGISNSGKILATVPDASISGNGPTTVREINLSTLKVTTRPDIQASGEGLFRPALQGAEIFLIDDGSVTLYESATDAFGGSKSLNFAEDGAVSADGNRIAVADALADGQLSSLGFAGYIDLFTLDASLQFGEKWNASGSLLYLPIDHGFDIVDGNSGTLRERISLADVINSTSASSQNIDTLVMDSTGQNVVMITTTGVTFIQLDEVPLGIGSASPSFGGQGTMFTLRGSGFVAGTTVSLNGAAATVNFVDVNTLHVTAPQNPSGPARITVTNPNGDKYSVDAAFNYGNSPPTQRIQLPPGKLIHPTIHKGISLRPRLKPSSTPPPFLRYQR